MLTDRDFASIYEVLEKQPSINSLLLTTKVIRRDETKKLIWVNELGTQPVPLIGFDFNVKYYDTNASGAVIEKVAKISIEVPHIGDTVLIAMERGTKRLPRCLGKIQSRDYIASSSDDA
jgi:hypothetical protein